MLRATGGLIAGVLLAAGLLATLGMDGSLHYPLAYPQALIAGVAVLFVASGVMDWREVRSRRSADDITVASSDMPGGPMTLWATIALCIAYAVSWTLIGCFPATFVYVVAQLWLLRQRHWYLLVGVPVAVTLLVYIVFAVLLALPFPPGVWFGG